MDTGGVIRMLKGKKVVLGVSGGIAAYKACTLVSRLVQMEVEVKVIMTKSAEEFISPLTFQALSRNPVYTDTFDEKDPEKIAHIDVADWADIFLLAPCTANIIGKLANGIADDMLSTTLLATEADVYLAPAMNVHMYAHPAVIENMQKLEKYGYKFIEPGSGYLACGYVGKGRLEDPETIIQVLETTQATDQFLSGKRMLISAGPTVEVMDPVRFFTNHSSGKMGFAIAEAAAEAGAEVTLVAGPVHLPTPLGVKRIDVVSAAEMYDQMVENFMDKEIVIKAAAVADYRPVKVYDEKIKKQSETISIEMERTTDILKTLGENKTNQYLVGFAAETNNHIEHGRKKLHKKNLNAVIINNIKNPGAGFNVDTNEVLFISRNGLEKELPLKPKKEIAKDLLKLIEKDRKEEKY